jgi:hypothetical protein
MQEATIPPGTGTTGMPPGPWLLVVGMHRSGTSAVTGAIGALGLAPPVDDDRWGWHETNPDHWESVSLNKFDGRLLGRLGGSWDAPPEPPDLGADAGADPADDPVAAARNAFPGNGPVVWKDPRICLLLPYWRARLPPPLAAVLVWRSPLAVARSLQRRDAMPLPTGVALWERHNRSALENLVGVDTYVCSYEAVIEDPPTVLKEMAGWLGTLPQLRPSAARWDLEAAVAMIGSGDDRPGSSGPDAPDHFLLDQHHELISRLTHLAGGHRPLGPTPLLPESAWTTAIIAARRGSRTRELTKLGVERSRLQEQLDESRRALDRLRASTSWRVTRPLRSVLSRLSR